MFDTEARCATFAKRKSSEKKKMIYCGSIGVGALGFSLCSTVLSTGVFSSYQHIRVFSLFRCTLKFSLIFIVKFSPLPVAFPARVST